jgi:2-oxoglutarate dehydrogenase E2 component (dihydrolipoamide succinyltransferase)
MATETAVDVVMPQMGVSVSEGTITKWLKQEGEQVEADEPLLEISTDKVDTEVPSPASGTLTQIVVQEGETVEVGAKLAQIGGAPATQAEAAAEQAPAGEPVPEEGAVAVAAPPPLMTATTVLTGTVSPSLTLISDSTPEAGAGISASTLSVEISNNGSSRLTASPTCLSHLTIVPSAMDSPICGIFTSSAIALLR